MNDAISYEVATALLTSGQSMSNTFKKVCKAARQRVCEPVSRSTRLNVSAPTTPFQKFERKLRKANAKQLTTWLRRTTRRGNRLQDLLFDTQASGKEKLAAALQQRIEQIDGIAQAINLELTSRASRGKLKHV